MIVPIPSSRNNDHISINDNDKDKDKDIAMVTLTRLSPRSAFKSLDVDKNNIITPDEVSRLLHNTLGYAAMSPTRAPRTRTRSAHLRSVAESSRRGRTCVGAVVAFFMFNPRGIR